jgi:hypothetical protein
MDNYHMLPKAVFIAYEREDVDLHAAAGDYYCALWEIAHGAIAEMNGTEFDTVDELKDWIRKRVWDEINDRSLFPNT